MRAAAQPPPYLPPQLNPTAELVGDDRLTALCAELEGAVSLRTDVVVRDEVKALVAKAEESFGKGVDVLVNVAGVMYFTMMKNLHEDEWERTIDTNCKGVVNGVGAVLQQMLARKRGRSRRRLPSENTARSTRDWFRSGHIVNISSDAAKQASPNG